MKGKKVLMIVVWGLILLITAGVVPCILIVGAFKVFDAPWNWLVTTATVVIEMVWLRLIMKAES